jgi:ABC-type spermidine/putrescine transport system permease subunit I
MGSELIKKKVGIDPAAYLLMPIILLLSVFMLFPVCRIFFLSFFDPDFTTHHYVEIFQGDIYLQVFLRTSLVALLVSVCCLILGYPVAYLLSDVPPKTARILLALVILPMWIGILVRTYAWMVVLGRHGFLNNTLMYFDLISEPIKVLFTSKAVILAMVQILLPLMILPLYATMKGIDRNLLKASRILGAGAWRSFFHIFLPLSSPGIMAGFTLVFIISIGFFITPALVGGRKDIMIAMLIESQITRILNWGFAAALSLILMAVTLLILWVFNRFVGIDRLITSINSR